MTTESRPLRFLPIAAALFGLLSACAPPGWEQAPPPTPSELDLAKMSEATQEALENNKDGVSTNWSVADSGHLGTATPTRTFENEAGAPCRDFQQTVTIDGRTQAAYGTACRNAVGAWNTTRTTPLEEVGPGGPVPAYRYPPYGYPGYGPWPYYGLRPTFYYGVGIGFGRGHFFGHHGHYRRHHHGHYRKRYSDK